jgi:hypothetical protein
MAAKPKSAGRSVSIAPPVGDNESVRIRQISNGYLISREGSKRGKYYQHEEYSPSKPQISAAPVEKKASKPKTKR